MIKLIEKLEKCHYCEDCFLGFPFSLIALLDSTVCSEVLAEFLGV